MNLPKSGPCSKRIDGKLVDAPYSVVGVSPQGGGGVLHWGWTFEEASTAADAYRKNGFLQVRVFNNKDSRLKQVVHEIVIGEVRKFE